MIFQTLSVVATAATRLAITKRESSHHHCNNNNNNNNSNRISNSPHRVCPPINKVNNTRSQ